MGTRIIVKCYSQEMPGKPQDRVEEMARILCQHHWHRDLDKEQDRLQSSGQYAYAGNRITLLLDNGPPDSTHISTFLYQWNGRELKEKPLSVLDHNRLKLYPFNPKDVPAGLNDDKYRERFGEEAYKGVVMERIKQRRRMGQRLLHHEEAFLEKHPALALQL